MYFIFIYTVYIIIYFISTYIVLIVNYFFYALFLRWHPEI